MDERERAILNHPKSHAISAAGSYNTRHLARALQFFLFFILVLWTDIIVNRLPT